MTDIRTIPSDSKSGNSQGKDAKRDRAYPPRSLTGLTEWQKKEALDRLRGGQSAHLVAMELSVRVALVLELWLRDLNGQVQQMRRAA